MIPSRRLQIPFACAVSPRVRAQGGNSHALGPLQARWARPREQITLRGQCRAARSRSAGLPCPGTSQNAVAGECSALCSTPLPPLEHPHGTPPEHSQDQAQGGAHGHLSGAELLEGAGVFGSAPSGAWFGVWSHRTTLMKGTGTCKDATSVHACTAEPPREPAP